MVNKLETSEWRTKLREEKVRAPLLSQFSSVKECDGGAHMKCWKRNEFEARGDLFSVEADGLAGPAQSPQSQLEVKCPECKGVLIADRDEMIIKTTVPKVIT